MHSFIDNRLRILIVLRIFLNYRKFRSTHRLSYFHFVQKKASDVRNKVMTIQKIDVNFQDFRTVPQLQCLTVHIPLLLKLPRHISTI